jgi:hypothetical protein
MGASFSMRTLLHNSAQVFLAGLVLVSLSACAGVLSFTPERAAVQQVMQIQGVQPESVQILQKGEVGELTVVLVGYRRILAQAGEMQCLAHYEMINWAGWWMAGSGGGGCSTVEAGGPPLGANQGSYRSNERAYSVVDGLVHQPDIREIEVTWEDGEAQRVKVESASYLVLRLGSEHRYQTVQAYDEQGERVYTLPLP